MGTCKQTYPAWTVNHVTVQCKNAFSHTLGKTMEQEIDLKIKFKRKASFILRILLVMLTKQIARLKTENKKWDWPVKR